MAEKSFANVYLTTKSLQPEYDVFDCCSSAEGCLYENGLLSTSLVESDLPPWFVSGWIPHHCLPGLETWFPYQGVFTTKGVFTHGGRPIERPLNAFGYISAKGVKELLYTPSYLGEDAPFSWDSLFISYDEPISIGFHKEDRKYFSGHDCVLTGAIIVPFVHAVAQYSNCKVDRILEELSRKASWRAAGAPPCRERVWISTRTGAHHQWGPLGGLRDGPYELSDFT